MQLIPDTIDFSEYMVEAEHHEVKPASHWLEDTIASFHAPATEAPAPTMLWQKARDRVRFRPGEVSLWAGINGHGKSMFLSQVVLDLCYQAQRTMVASFEMKPVSQMQRMSRQAAGSRLPSVDFLETFGSWTDGRLWIYDHVGSVEWRKVIAVMRYAAVNFGIGHFVIDSLMKCVKGEDDYNAQKDFVNELCAFAQAHNVHIHLVHHVRKGESEHKAPGKFDVKGAGAITDQVDNVFIVWRNKIAAQENNGDPTCVVACEKQRNGEFEGKLGFWFDIESQQYLETIAEMPSKYGVDGTGGKKGYAMPVRFFARQALDMKAEVPA
ncbi:AAA family ATPase [Pseudoduganella chitinolytica]|uniref:AAA family ATPase n=1 Tax=Pseudoduganella chitinolytica TaxID=34070 RepID=A0ABY8BG49_9BURK|nr:AAA family ATPase [Pseudoduganella chitinolytica]WEF34880.1 AAA family ATPase [Pseudoduganella chitinolytica]